jgi:S-adenosylmethionine:diacylglycerol 3-amino-3-carboxypropyl transferase
VRNLVRAGFSQPVAMAIAGHVTASVFRRYGITNDEDIAAALDPTAADVAKTRTRERRVAMLTQNTDRSGLKMLRGLATLLVKVLDVQCRERGSNHHAGFPAADF